MNEFAEQYRQAGFNSQQLPRLLGSFMNNHDVSTSILNENFGRIPVNPYFLVVQTASKPVTILISLEGLEGKAIPKDLKTGDQLVVDGIFMDEKDTVLHPIAFQTGNKQLEDGLVRVTGKVTDFLLPERRSYNPFYQDGLINQTLQEWAPQADQYRSELQSGKPLQMTWSDNWSGIEYAILVKALPNVTGGERYLFVMASLQPVGEAVEILKQYFIYIAPLILILAVILSLIYSRIVSRPLVMLSRSAARLAKLNFTGQHEIRSKDEFGELSRNLISLSQNLDTALKELKQANVTLQEDIEEKKKSEELRKELIANISHELKTPLGIVKGFAEGLQDGIAGDKKDRYLALIVHETDRMNDLIMDMLELSKFEAKAVRLQPGTLALVSLIRKAADSFSRQMESKQLVLEVNSHGEGEWFVHADPRRIEQVVLNLLSNAIRHAMENSIIGIEISRTAPGQITTVIENSGSPIAEEDLTRLWDHFYRAERSRDRKSGGTGLGLAIVKHIMELHAGGFGVNNTERGVAFYFNLTEIKGDNHYE